MLESQPRCQAQGFICDLLEYPSKAGRPSGKGMTDAAVYIDNAL